MAGTPYTLQGKDDFVRLDALCHELLKEFAGWLQHRHPPAEPPEAGAAAHAADRYLRDFVVDIKETGPADADPTLVQQYLANWYIINTLEPSHEEIDHIAGALDRLYLFLVHKGVVAAAAAAQARQHLADTGFFHQRLESFWELSPDAIAAWRQVHDFRRPRLEE